MNAEGIVLLTEASPWVMVPEAMPIIPNGAFCSNWNEESMLHRLANQEPEAGIIPALNFILRFADNNTINGARFDATATSNPNALLVSLGSAVSITFANDARESLSVYVDGHSFVVTSLDGVKIERGAKRDTLLIPSGRSASVLLMANNPGVFIVACKNEIRQWRGMATTIEYIAA